MDYEQIRPTLKTFDIVNAKDRNWFWAMIGHTAAIYVDEDIAKVNILESTQRSKFDKSGVQLNTASEWFKRSSGRAWVRQISFADGISLAEIDLCKARGNKFIELTRGMAYPNLKTRSGLLKVMLSAVDLYNPFNGKDIIHWNDSESGIFCTQEIVAWYIYSGLTICQPEDLELALRIAVEFEPDDTLNKCSRFDRILRKGVTLGNGIEVKYNFGSKESK